MAAVDVRACAQAHRDGSGSVGWLSGGAAYVLWGMFPAFFGLLSFATPIEILAHRVTWTLVLLMFILAVTGRLGSLRGHSPRTWQLLVAGSAAISVNWGVYIYAVSSGHVAEAALGYFINPLLTVLFGVFVFRERLNRWGIGAVAVAAVAVAVITVGYGRPPFIALSLAVSFATYGAIKKMVGVDPRVSLSAETLLIAPLAIGYLIATTVGSQIPHTSWTPAHLALLVAAGPMTAVPLLLFGVAAQRLPVVTLGLLQYITPALQFLWAVFVRQEPMNAAGWIGFSLVWIALSVFTVGAVRSVRGTRTDAPVLVNSEKDTEWV